MIHAMRKASKYSLRFLELTPKACSAYFIWHFSAKLTRRLDDLRAFFDLPSFSSTF